MNKTNTFTFFPKWRKSFILTFLIGMSFLSASFLTTIFVGPGIATPQAIGTYLNGNLPSSVTGTAPSLLSQTGAFSNLTTLTPSTGVIPYDMIEPFWSDGAAKSRWMAIPNNGTHNTAAEKIQFSSEGNWEFPIGAVLIKHFEIGGKRLETRFEVRGADGTYYYLSYKWNSGGTDASLLTTGLDETIIVNGQPQIWHYPSPAECLDCHKQEVGSVLGPKTRYLNSEITYPSTGLVANQLVTLSHLGIIDENITDVNTNNYMAIAAHDDLNYDLEYRARSYIDVNCSYCHQPATNIGQFDARITTPLEQQNIINGPVAYDLGLSDPRIIAPQNIPQSVVHTRMNSLQPGTAMPPLAKNVIHQEGVQLIADWISNITIDNNNSIPIASFTTNPLSGNAPLNVNFDASSSFDPDGGTLVYSWDFGDDNVGLGVNTSHSYNTPGTYAVVLTVNDGQNIGQQSATIIVNDNGNLTFSDQTNLLSAANYSGVSMSVVDMNGDGKDDIVRYNGAKTLNIQYQQGPNQAFTGTSFGDVSSVKQWSNSIADVDQDGFNDIMTAGFYDNVKILRSNNGQAFNSTTIPNSEIFLQGSNFADIDNDGWIDAFACHDDADSREFRNNGDGTFTFSPSMINTTTSPASDNSGNYASIWTDYDNDGDLDLYISKCRIGVNSAADPRRINMLFQNDGNNNYTEVAAAANLKIGAQTWLTDFGDIDNDGDMDCIVINHFSNANLMRNNGNGTFTDITSSSGLLPALDGNKRGIQAFFRDFNNDGFVDLLVSGVNHFLFYNDGDGTFTQTTNPFNANQIESVAVGDLNHDGFLDIYAGYANIYNSPTSIQDRLFTNDGNSNNFLAVQLDGVESNINAIGARVELYGSWGKQIREVRSGEGYGVMNSFTQHFGIGGATQISKVVVKWPSGAIDEVLNPAPNQFLKIQEGSTTVAVCTSDNAEPNNTFNGSENLGTSDNFNVNSLCLTSGDEDYFVFSTNGQTYYARVRGADATSVGEYQLSIQRTGSELILETLPVTQLATNTYLYLYSDNQQLLAENDDFSNTFSKITYTIPDTGGGTTVSCEGNTTITYGEGIITMSGQAGQEYFFQILDAGWNEVYNCGWQCGASKTVSGLTAGEYRIYIKNSDYVVICEKVITLSTGGNDPDNDGDGVPASQDCNDDDPNLTTIGASCDDGNTDTTNDLVQANCTCAGTPSGGGGGTTVSCDGNTTITYGDGNITMAGQAGQEYYFQILDAGWNEVYNCGWQCGFTKTVTGLTAGDYRIYIKNSDYVVICEKVITLSTGGTDPDNDGDGVPASQDCNDDDANLTTVGASCDDGNTNTTNDIVQANCTCAGTTTGGGGGTTVSCEGNTTITYGEGVITMSGQASQEYFFQILDAGWNEVYNCGWQCGYTKTVTGLTAGDYRIYIKNSDYVVICEKVITLSTGGTDPDNDGDGVPASIDCDDDDANLTTVGASCDDGNTETTNDVVQSNCTCAGSTTGGGGQTITSCGELTITYGDGIVDMVGIVGKSYFFKISDLNDGWAQAFSCGWNCGYQQTATDLPNSRYLITINNDDWTEHCTVEIQMTNSSFTQSTSNRSAPQLNFEAFNAQRAVDLQWLTNSGFKVKEFEVQRSADGENFESIEKSVNKNWSEDLAYHQTTDLTPVKGTNYYRIKEIYLDDSFAYTVVKQVNYQVDVDKLSIYPNPAENILNLSLKPLMGKSTTINIINAFGQVVQTHSLEVVKEGNTQIALNNTISNGFYHVWIEAEGQRPVIKKLIVKRLY